MSIVLQTSTKEREIESTYLLFIIYIAYNCEPVKLIRSNRNIYFFEKVAKASTDKAPPPLAKTCNHKHNNSNAKELKKLMGHDCGKKSSGSGSGGNTGTQAQNQTKKSKSTSAISSKVREIYNIPTY